MPNQKEAFETFKAHTYCCLWPLELNNSKSSFHSIYISLNQTLLEASPTWYLFGFQKP